MSTSPAILQRNQNRVQLQKPRPAPRFAVYHEASEAAQARREWKAKQTLFRRVSPNVDAQRATKFGTPNSRKRSTATNTLLRAQIVNNFAE